MKTIEDVFSSIEVGTRCKHCNQFFEGNPEYLSKEQALQHVQMVHVHVCFCCEVECDDLYYHERHDTVYCCIQGGKDGDYNKFCDRCKERMQQMIADDSSYYESTSWKNLPKMD